jgi:hypothetical protein
MKKEFFLAMSYRQQIYEILKDGKPHRSDEITRALFGSDKTDRTGLFNLHGRVSELRKQGYNIPPAWRDRENPKLSWYQMILPAIIPKFNDLKPAGEVLSQKRINIQARLDFKLPPIFKDIF